MRVLFVNLPWKGKDYAVRAGSRWAHSINKTKKVIRYMPFPFQMASSAALIEKDCHVKIIDALAEEIGEEEFLHRLTLFKPDVVVAEISTPSYDNDIWYLKKIKDQLGSHIIVAGQHPSALPEELAKENPFIDYILVGEYEFLLKGVIDQLNKKKRGTTLNKNADRIIRSAKLGDIDKIPWPARHLFNMQLYNEPFCHAYPNIQMIASRGCFYRCSYCNTFLMYNGRNYRFRNPSDIIDELEHVVDTYHPKEIYFDDDLINGLPAELEKVCELKIKRGIDTPFSAMAHSNISRHTLELMKKAGCRALKFGVESANEGVLGQLGKGTTIGIVKKAVEKCRELGIKTHLTYAIGLPGDTRETIKQTIEFAMKFGDSYQISLSTPYPGTPLYELAKKNGWLIVHSWSDFDGAKKGIINYPHLSSEEIYRLYLLGQKSVYRKFLESGEYIKFIKMTYQDGGLINLARLFFVRGPGILKSIIESKLELK